MSFSQNSATRSYAEDLIRRHYIALKRRYGRQHWWPAESRLEVIAGTILTQNTSWRNVEQALANLKQVHKLSLKSLREIEIGELEQLIRPSGYFRQKARRLKAFIEFLDSQYGGSLEAMFASGRGTGHERLRERLLEINGIGPETADSILLYAGRIPVFVVDAYARRILGRHGIAEANRDYEELRDLVEQSLAKARLSRAQDKKLGHAPSRQSRLNARLVTQHLNEFHGLLVQVGKRHCFKNAPDCNGCPLKSFLPADATVAAMPLR